MSVDEIATTALDLDAGPQRERYLDQACRDEETRQRVESLINALEQTDEGSFLKGGFLDNFDEPLEPQTGRSQLGPPEDPSKRFVIKSRHAVGGLGEVCVAWDSQLRREVALKRIRTEWSRDTDAAARFRREAEITGYLEHPGIVPIYSLGDQTDGRPFYAMQFIRGRTLEEIVLESLENSEYTDANPTAAPKTNQGNWHNARTLRRLLDHVVDVCQTIDYAHSKQVIHRDLKPSNIMIGSYGQTLVVDWGLAKRLDQVDVSDEGMDHEGIDHEGMDRNDVQWQRSSNDSDSDSSDSDSSDSDSSDSDSSDSDSSDSDSSVDETRQGTTLGTPRFMSPEQASGNISEVGAPADIYCLGATLYFALTGQPPHVGENDLQSTLNRIIQGQLRSVREFSPQIPGALDAITNKAMATKQNERYETAGEFAADLQRFLDDQPIDIYRDTWSERLLRWTRNHSAMAASIAVAVLLIFMASIAGLAIEQHIDRRETEIAREKENAERKFQFEQTTRTLEAKATSEAALERAQAALRESRYADAAGLIGVAADRMKDQPTMIEKRDQLISRRDRLARLGEFDSLRESGEDLDFLSRDTEAAILLQESLAKLGVWDSQTWWADLPDQDLSALQRDRLQRQVYRVLTALNSLYVTKMVSAMGGGFEGGTPSMLKMFRSYLSSNIGIKEAEAAAELTRRIQAYRPCQSARWLGSIAGTRLHQNKRIDVKLLGPPKNAADGMQMGVFSLIASADPSYRNWFAGYGDSFLPAQTQDPVARCLNVARESLRRVSDDASDDYWIRLTLGQTYYLHAQAAQRDDDFDAALEFYELARSEYGRCIAIRPLAPFGHADRSTVALNQALMIQNHTDAVESQLRRADELLRTSLRDASQAKRLAPLEHWVYWHVGATAAALGQDDLATEAFLSAVELGFDVRGNTDGPVIALDDIRGREFGIRFAKKRIQSETLESLGQKFASHRLSLYAALLLSRGDTEKSLAHATHCVEMDPTNLIGHRIAGWCQLRSGAWASAKSHFDEALKIDRNDALSLIGAARISETDAANDGGIDLQESDRWYRAAAQFAKSSRHQAIAWIGIAKHALRRHALDQSFDALRRARGLDPACDVAQFLELGRDQAKSILRESKKNPTQLPRTTALEQIKQLRQFLDQVAQLPIASIKQILDSANQSVPRELALLGGDFGLPLELHWDLESISRGVNGLEFQSYGTSPPMKREGIQQNACLQIQSNDPDVQSGRWSLSQTIPAPPGSAYQLRFKASSQNDSASSVKLAVYHQTALLCGLILPSERFEWKTFETTFATLPSKQDFVELEIKILVDDPGQSVVSLDDLSIISISSSDTPESQ